MKAITLHQPWAWAIAAGHKRIENRPWSPPAHHVGTDIAIHAGNKWDEIGARFIRVQLGMGAALLPPEAETKGAIVAVAFLRDWYVKDPPWDHAGQEHVKDDPWFFGPIGWLLENVRALPEPVPCRGFQKLWTLPADVEAQIMAQLEARA